MHLIRDLKIQAKIGLLAAFGFAAIVVGGLVGVDALRTTNGNLRSMYETNVRGLELISRADSQVRAIQVSALSALLMGDNTVAGALGQEVRAAADSFNRSLESYITLARVDGTRARAEEAREKFGEYVSLILEAVRQAQAGARQEDLLPMVVGVIAPLRAELNDRMTELISLETEHAQAAAVTGQRQYEFTLWAFLATLGLGSVLAATLTILLARSITVPLRRVVDGAARLAEGDLSRPVGYRARDEIGLMAQGFDRALEGLRALIASVREHTEQVASSSQELAGTAEEVGRSVSQVAESVDQIARGGQQQSEAATTTSRIVRQIGDAVEQVNAATESMVKGADQASRLAEEGRSALEAMVARMDQIQRAVGESGAAVQNLGERSQKIGQIVDVITNIAEQTNLLALNAAIEAARAGDQGRGFAVVAEEIRKLAQESGKAASEIAGLVAEIRHEVERAVRDTRAGASAVAEGVEAMTGSGKTFQAITRTVEEMARQMQEVNAAAGKMAARAAEAIKAVDDIAAITEENAAMTQEVASATQEQSAAVAQISTAAADLATLAQELAQAVAAFKA